jgi:hypothetical protein
MGQQIAKKCERDTELLTEDDCGEIGAYRNVDREWMSLYQIVSNTPGTIVTMPLHICCRSGPIDGRETKLDCPGCGRS